MYGTMGVPAAGEYSRRSIERYQLERCKRKSLAFWRRRIRRNGATGFLNDLWKYNPTTQQWAWIDGSKTLSCGTTSRCCIAEGSTVCMARRVRLRLRIRPGAAMEPPAGRTVAVTYGSSAGYGMNAVDTLQAELNDLWEYDPATNEWTWMGGSNKSVLSFYSTMGQPGVYGTLGVPAPTNIPGSRYNAATWVDVNGKFWLFGGTGQDVDGLSAVLNDLWMYDPSTHQWTWMGGSDAVEVLPATRGVLTERWVSPTKEIFRPAVPRLQRGPITAAICGCSVDTADRVSTRSTISGNMIPPRTNGRGWRAPAIHLHPEVRGTLGIPAPANTPGGTSSISANWTDAQGNLWLLGGDSASITGANQDSYLGPANELWAFNPSTNEWAWMGGNYVGNCQLTVSVNSYPTCNGPQGIGQGIPTGGEVPAGRVRHSELDRQQRKTLAV